MHGTITPFSSVVPDEKQQAALERVRVAFSDLDALICEVALHCRSRSVARTHLEEAAMWVNKAITHLE
jgi:hypothetical protein